MFAAAANQVQAMESAFNIVKSNKIFFALKKKKKF